MSEQTRELDGQAAVVTGSAKNIGRAINLALSRAKLTEALDRIEAAFADLQ